jgi:hypothetical protein
LSKFSDDPLNHWLLRKEVINHGSKKEQARFALLQFWLLVTKLLAFVNERESMEAIMKNENIPFSPVLIQHEKRSHKRIKLEDNKVENGEFVGWKLPQGTSTVVHSITDTALYLARHFLYDLIQELIPKT